MPNQCQKINFAQMSLLPLVLDPPLIYKAKYKGLNSQNLYPAITFDWSVLRTWGQRLWAAYWMLFSGIPHLPTLRDTWHVTIRDVCDTCDMTYVTRVTWQKVGKWGIPEKSSKNAAQRRWPQVRRTLQSKVMAGYWFLEISPLLLYKWGGVQN